MHKMGAILNLALVLGGLSAIILGKGPEKVSAIVDDQLEKADIDFRLSEPIPQPIDQGNELPQIPTGGQPIIVSRRETTPKRFNESEFRIESIPEQNEIISVSAKVDSIEPKTPKTIIQEPKPISKNVQTGIEGKRFTGGGPSFRGGQVRETPISRLSLGQIAQKLGISASKAASLKAEATGELDRIGFDFGTNTGSGLKGSTPEAIRESRLDKLKAEEQKALQVFGSGSISNF